MSNNVEKEIKIYKKFKNFVYSQIMIAGLIVLYLYLAILFYLLLMKKKK